MITDQIVIFGRPNVTAASVRAFGAHHEASTTQEVMSDQGDSRKLTPAGAWRSGCQPREARAVGRVAVRQHGQSVILNDLLVQFQIEGLSEENRSLNRACISIGVMGSTVTRSRTFAASRHRGCRALPG
jgi:hypothetical protein